MSKQLQLRRGNQSDTSIFIGAVGEITIVEGKNVAVVHDAIQAGGYPMAREDKAHMKQVWNNGLQQWDYVNVDQTDPGSGYIYTSPNGSVRVLVTIDNAGAEVRTTL